MDKIEALIKSFIPNGVWIYDPVLDAWKFRSELMKFDFDTLECIRNNDDDTRFCISTFFENADNALILKALGFKEDSDFGDIFHYKNILMVKIDGNIHALRNYDTDIGITYKEILEKISSI